MTAKTMLDKLETANPTRRFAVNARETVIAVWTPTTGRFEPIIGKLLDDTWAKWPSPPVLVNGRAVDFGEWRER